jgi:hypothetical protein
MTEILTKSDDILGKPLIGLVRAKLGVVREIFVNLSSSAVQFVVVEATGLFGGSGKFHPIPWSAVRYDPADAAFRIEVGKDDFKGSPSYDREQLADPTYGWREVASRHFSAPQAPLGR